MNDKIIPQKMLSFLANIVMGQSPSSKFYNSDGNGVVLVQGNSDLNNRKTISRVWTTKATKEVKANSILMSVRAPVGHIALSSEKICIGRGFCSIEPKEDTSKEFLYHYLISLEKRWKRVKQGSTFSSVNKKEIEKLLICQFCIKEQKKIAKILNCWDEAIETLEKLVEAKEKFNRGLRRMLLNQTTRSPLFHKKWKTKNLGDLTNIKTGSKDLKDKDSSGSYPFYVRSDNIHKINTYAYDGEAILIPGEGRVGEIFHYINGKFDYHQRVYMINKFSNIILSKYIYFYLQEFFKRQAIKYSVKATVNSLRLPMFLKMAITYPCIKEQELIVKTLNTLESETKILSILQDDITSQKRGLMQQLLTGKTRVKV